MFIMSKAYFVFIALIVLPFTLHRHIASLSKEHAQCRILNVVDGRSNQTTASGTTTRQPPQELPPGDNCSSNEMVASTSTTSPALRGLLCPRSSSKATINTHP